MVRHVLALFVAGALVMGTAESGQTPPRGPLDPRGRIHIPIGIANTLDSLKTFVEPEGCFSPGVGSYGVCLWLYDAEKGKLWAPTMDGVKVEHGLVGTGHLIPWSSWNADGIAVKTEVCEVKRPSPAGEVFVVAARVQLSHKGAGERTLALYSALRPLGPAGFPVHALSVSDAGDALLIGGHAALVANERPTAAGVLETDSIGDEATQGKTPVGKQTLSMAGNCSGALRFGLALAAGESRTLGFVCPVLPGRRAVGHQWDGKSGWAQLDLAKPDPREGGALQPDPGLDYYRGLKADALFKEAEVYWKDLVGRATIRVPDPRWAECFAAIVGHVALCMNGGAPDVAVVNYNVFNRDGVYVASILQKSGNFDLSEQAIDYFLGHPFNGRVNVEADNPGQVLWAMGQHWLLSRDAKWLARVYPAAAKLAAMIRYYRTAPPPHYVKATSLDFGDALPPDKPDELPAFRRQVLKPGSCDGHHPEYTEAFDIAGLRAAALLARAAGNEGEAAEWRKLADALFEKYDATFGAKLRNGYGSYSVLWPCELYSFGEGKGHEQFKGIGAQKPGGWRYFPLATAHQGLLAGNREAGYRTIEEHLKHEQMRGWYAFDEGGRSGSGGWGHLRTTWNPSVAMPHGWAIAEMWLLLRDCLAFEEGDRLVLLAGVDPAWFRDEKGIAAENLPTHFGACSFTYMVKGSTGTLKLTGDAEPPGGVVLRAPKGDVAIPPGTREATIEW
ncbi:MAG TPA: hypothetical protein VNE39_22460 [Planctomycetota bacterium]|nr:hypothetical protein [Planctomycetota bacterium]